ncbi:MAG: AraC family transcriptional regulator [Lachnospiraceae bacterium]
MQIITNNSLLEQKAHGSFNFPVLVSYETISKYDSGSFLLHWHPEIELTLIIHGEMIYNINGNEIILKESDALFCNTGALHSGKMLNNHDCDYVSITFDPKIIYGYESSSIYLKYVCPVIQNFSFGYLHYCHNEKWSQETIQLIKKIISLYNLMSSSCEIDITIALLRIWKIIFDHSIIPYENNEISSLTLSRLRSIISYIELNYRQKIFLADISNHINLCEGECCRLFKKAINISIFDYIQEFRIKKACELLSETKYSISVISEMVGYSDSNNFSKSFRKYMDSSPREYRAKKK